MNNRNPFAAGTERHARFARLDQCTADDQVVIPDGWTPPDDTSGITVAVDGLEPGVTFTHDGGTDRLPWYGPPGYAYTADLAVLGLESESTLERWAALDALPVGAVAELSPPATFGPDDYLVGMPDGVRVAAVRLASHRAGAGVWRLKPEGSDGWPYTVRTEQIDALGLTPDNFTTGDDAGLVERVQAALGLTPDDSTAGDDAPAGPRVTESDAVPEGTAIAGDFTAADDDEHDEHDGDDEPKSIGTVTIDVVPDTTAFEDRIKAVAAEVSGTLRGLDEELEARPRPVSVITGSPLSDLAGHLDEYAQERVAALELAMRVLEARRRPSGTGTGFGNLIGAVPGKMIDVQDMIDVAAFIATGDTGRLEDEQEDQA